MRWTHVRFETSDIVPYRRDVRWVRYAANLPLVADGRLALFELGKNRERATVERFTPDEGHLAGKVRVIDNRCTFTWRGCSRDTPPDVRLFGTHFTNNAIVALRPGNGPAQLFKVTLCERATARDLKEAAIRTTDPAI